MHEFSTDPKMLTFNYGSTYFSNINLIHLCVPHGLRFNLRYIKFLKKIKEAEPQNLQLIIKRDFKSRAGYESALTH